MRVSTKLSALLILGASAGVPFLGCGSGDDDDDRGAGKADATADGTTTGHVDSGGGAAESGNPQGSLDGGADAANGDSSATVVCPASAPADFSDAAVAATCTRFVYLAGGDNTLVIASVDEGATWQSQHFHNIDGDDYVNNFAVYRGVTTASSLPGVFQSTDPTGGYNDGGPEAGDAGITFGLVSAIVSGGFDTYGGQLAVNGSGVFFADNQSSYVTKDEVTWSSLDAGGFGGHWYGTAASPTTYVALQGNGTFRSYDGTTVTDGTLTLTPAGGNDVAYGGGRFVAVGGAQFTTSADAKTWTAAGTIVGDGGAGFTNPNSILWDGTRFLAYAGTTVAISADTRSWTFMKLTARIDTAATSEGHFVAVGNLSNAEGILLSTDGLVWTMAHPFAASETANINGWRVGLGRVLK